MTALLFFASAASASLLTWWVRMRAVQSGWMDTPNARSSHSVPTPRGGGISFVLTTLAGALALVVLRPIGTPLATSFVIGGSLVACVGFIDDRQGLAAQWRFMAHMIAIAAVIVGLSVWSAPPLVSMGTVARAFCIAVILIGGVWVINLTNFMDGIDGLAGMQAVTVCTGIVVCAMQGNAPAASVLMPIVLGAGVLGFLVWNWPPARIFMGDVGSGFLGFSFAALALDALRESPRLFWCWIILMGVFVTDTTFTLLRRLLRGDRVTEAHRTHGYQHASRRWRGHQPVTLAIALMNLCWLLPCALLVSLERLPVPIGIAVAYVPLVVLALWSDSGAREAVVTDFATRQRSQ